MENNQPTAPLCFCSYGDTGDLPVDASGTYDSTQYDGYSEHQAPYGDAAGPGDSGTEWHVSTEVLEAWRSDLATMGYATADLTLEQLYYLYMQQYAQDATVQEPYSGGFDEASGTYGCVNRASD